MELLIIIFYGIMPLFAAGQFKPGIERALLYYLSGLNTGAGIIIFITNLAKC